MNTLTWMCANSRALLFGFLLKESVDAHCRIFNRTACSLLAEKTSDVVIRKNFVVRHGIILEATASCRVWECVAQT